MLYLEVASSTLKLRILNQHPDLLRRRPSRDLYIEIVVFIIYLNVDVNPADEGLIEWVL